MKTSGLYYTAMPVLLGDPAMAGRLAADIYCRHGKTAHWFGTGFHLLLAIYAQRHPLPLPLTPEGDTIQFTSLKDFAKQQRHSGGLICLIPCGETAEAFIARNHAILSEYYLILPRTEKGEDPLSPLLRRS